jgi:hypothetical protein
MSTCLENEANRPDCTREGGHQYDTAYLKKSMYLRNTS